MPFGNSHTNPEILGSHKEASGCQSRFKCDSVRLRRPQHGPYFRAYFGLGWLSFFSFSYEKNLRQVLTEFVWRLRSGVALKIASLELWGDSSVRLMSKRTSGAT